MQSTTVVQPTCVVCQMPIDEKPVNGVVAWPVDKDGPKHWKCFMMREYHSVECPTCKGVGRIYDKQ